MNLDQDLLEQLGQADEDEYNCGLAISSVAGFSLIQAYYDPNQRELTIQPKRFWHEGPHQVETLLQRFRLRGYRVELVGDDGEGNVVYVIIRTYLILSAESLVQMLSYWLNRP
jgi:hypothetical protein